MKNNKVLALITARGGSKRLPGKNTKELGGLPLISWTIRAAKASSYISRLILSTDDAKAVEIAHSEKCEVPFVRPKELSGDYSTSFDVVEHALQSIEENDYEWLLLLQPTSPFRTTEDIDLALECAISQNVDSLISVCESDKSHLMLFAREPNGCLKSYYGINLKDLNNSRSQDFPACFEINGAIYVVKVSWLLKNKAFFDEYTVSYVMPKMRSVNIDTEDDWMLAETYLRNGVKR